MSSPLDENDNVHIIRLPWKTPQIDLKKIELTVFLDLPYTLNRNIHGCKISIIHLSKQKALNLLTHHRCVLKINPDHAIFNVTANSYSKYRVWNHLREVLVSLRLRNPEKKVSARQHKYIQNISTTRRQAV